MTDKTPFTEAILNIENLHRGRVSGETQALTDVEHARTMKDYSVLSVASATAKAHSFGRRAYESALKIIREAEAKWLEEQEPTTEDTNEEKPTLENLTQRIHDATQREINRTYFGDLS